MATHRVEIKRSATRELSRMRPEVGRKLLTSIESLGGDPRPRPSRKLSGSEDSYRLRVGDYRVLYQIDDAAKLLTVYHVGHRREVYR